MRPLAVLLVLATFLVVPRALSAQARTGAESLDPAIERRVAAEIVLGAWEPTLARDIVLEGLSVYPSGRLGLWANDASGLGTFELEGTVRSYFGETYDDVGRALYFSMGSSTLALMFGWTDRARVRVRAGPAIVVPFAMLNGARESTEDMTYYGRAAFGFWDPWEGFVRGPGALARADVDVRDDVLIAGAQLAAGPSFWLDDANDGGLREVPIAVAYYQVAAYVGAQALEWLALGVRMQLVGWSEGGGARRLEVRLAEAQASLVPFARVLAPPWFFEARGTLNLGEPEGVGSRSLVWAVRIAGGIELGP